MATLAQAITEMIQKALPTPNIKIGTVTSVLLSSEDGEGNPVKGRVMVSGISEPEVDLACDWSDGFDLMMSAFDQDLVGRTVEVHFSYGQPIISHTVIIGDKS